MICNKTELYPCSLKGRKACILIDKMHLTRFSNEKVQINTDELTRPLQVQTNWQLRSKIPKLNNELAQFILITASPGPLYNTLFVYKNCDKAVA